MKTAFAAALLSLCLSAQAYFILIDAGPAAWLDGHKVEQVSVELFNGDPAIPGELARSRQPFDANLKAVDGQIVAMTEAEIDARAAQQAQAEAEAEAAATLPIQSATGFAVLDNDGHWVELEPTGDGLPVIGVQVSNSPLTPEERASMKAERKAAHDALKAAAKDKKLNDKGKIALLMKAVFGVEE